MDNLKIIESLSKTSAFNENLTKELILQLKHNINLDFTSNDHLNIREKISNRQEFADAQADNNFKYCL